MVGAGDALAIGLVLGIVAIEALPLKVKRIIYGTILIVLGTLPFLTIMGVIKFDIYAYAITKYIVFIIIIVIGKALFAEGIKEQQMHFKIPSIILGFVIVLLTAIPTLHGINAISFALPAYPPVIDFIIYVAAGVFAIVGAFKAGGDF